MNELFKTLISYTVLPSKDRQTFEKQSKIDGSVGRLFRTAEMKH